MTPYLKCYLYHLVGGNSVNYSKLHNILIFEPVLSVFAVLQIHLRTSSEPPFPLAFCLLENSPKLQISRDSTRGSSIYLVVNNAVAVKHP